MDRLRGAIETIRSSLGAMTASQKLLIGSLAIILVMTLFVVSQYTKKPNMMALLEGAAPGEQQQALNFLRANNIPHEVADDGTVLVAPHRVRGVIAQMTEEGELPTDTRLTFNSLIEQQSWTKTYQQNAQAEVVALQNELALVIQQMDGIRSARVIVDVPKPRIGEPHRVATAVATVFADRPLNQNTVDAIAHLVASSRAGLTIEQVRVIDGVSNRQLRARTDDQLMANSYQELQSKHEGQARQQIEELLGAYIPGVIVSVRAQVDMTSRSKETRRVFPDGQGSATLLSEEMVDENELVETDDAAESGARPNTQEDIYSAAGSGTSSTSANAETRFDTQFGGETERVVDPRGFATKMNAVVNIPRPYFVSLWKMQQPAGEGDEAADGEDADAAEPTDADLQPIMTAEIERITQEIEMLIDTSLAEGGEQGEVVVSMIPTMPEFSLGGAGAPGTASILGVPMGDVTVPQLVQSLGLGGLAVLALGLVVFTALRANKQDELPSASELIGLPKELKDDLDLVGEAMETDSPLSGIELSDDDLAKRQRMDQISALVQSKPEEAAMVIKRWMAEGP